MSDKYGIHYNYIRIPDVYLFTTPVPDDGVILLHQVPLLPNQVHEIMSVDVVCTTTLLVDAADINIVGSITPYDYSAVADATAIFTGGAGAAGDLKTAQLDLKIPDRLYTGPYTLERGDSIRAILSVVTPTTAGVGYFFVVGYRVKQYNG